MFKYSSSMLQVIKGWVKIDCFLVDQIIKANRYTAQSGYELKGQENVSQIQMGCSHSFGQPSPSSP